MKIIFGLFLCLVFAAVGFSQTLRTSGPVPIGKIGVLIYASALTEVLEKRSDYATYLDGKEIAHTHPGQYFIAVVSPGKHSFQIGELSTRKLELEIKTNQSYFLRVNEISDDCQSKDFEIITYDKWQEERKDLKMIKNADVKDPEIAVDWQEG